MEQTLLHNTFLSTIFIVLDRGSLTTTYLVNNVVAQRRPTLAFETFPEITRTLLYE